MQVVRPPEAEADESCQCRLEQPEGLGLGEWGSACAWVMEYGRIGAYDGTFGCKAKVGKCLWINRW